MTNAGKTKQPVCAIVGAGPGNGAAFARCFAQAGYQIALLARNLGRLEEMAKSMPNAKAFACDVTDQKSIETAFAKIANEMGEVEVLIYNTGKGVWGDALSVTPENFELAWQVNAFGGYLAARQVLPAMQKSGSGTIIFSGATASLRGGAKMAAFASAKAAQKNLAESIARSYGPDGVHVALMIIDAIVGEPLMKEKFKDRPDDFFCDPDDIAKTALMLANQPRSAWTFQLDLRPFGENW